MVTYLKEIFAKISLLANVNGSEQTEISILAHGTKVSNIAMELIHGLTETNTKEITLMISVKVKENSYGLMVINMKVSGKTAFNTAKAKKLGLTAISTPVIGKNLKSTVMAKKLGQMVTNISANTRMISGMEKEYGQAQLVTCLLVCMKMKKDMALVNSIGLTVINSKEHGTKENVIVKESMSGKMVSSMRVNS
jgi:hypothetical protein